MFSTRRPSVRLSLALLFAAILAAYAGQGTTHAAAKTYYLSSGAYTTFYDADDPRCTPHRFDPGMGTPEVSGHVHITRNEGDTPLVLDVVFLVPPGGNPGIAQPRPGNCPF